METLKDKLDADARFEANPPKPAPIDDPTKLFQVLADAYVECGDFENMPRCTTKALVDLLLDDDPNADIQERAMLRLSAEAIDTLAKALVFARSRLSAGSEIDRAHVRGIDELLRKAGFTLTALTPPKEPSP